MWRKRRPKVILDVEAGQTGLSTRKLILESFGYNVLAAASGHEALQLLKGYKIDGVLLDESANDVPLQKLTSEVKACGAIPVVLALDQVLGIRNVPPASGEAIDVPGTE